MKQRFIEQRVPTKDMVARYKLWAGLTTTGEVFDYSLNGNTGTVSGAVPAYPGFLFDGTDDCIDCGSDSTIDDLFAGGGTFACWLLASGRGENNAGRIMDKGALILSTVTDAATILFEQVFTAGDNGRWTVPITTAIWQHLILVYDNDLGTNAPTIYINGVSATVTEAQAPGNDNATSDAASTLFIGDSVASVFSWDGKIGEVLLFDAEKTAAEAKSIYEITRWRYDT